MKNTIIFEEITGKVIASLEQGLAPWRQPWKFTGVPVQNHFSGHVYRGINTLLLNLGDLPTPYFGTFEQITKAGGRLKKGSKARNVYFNDLLIYDKNGKRVREEVYKTLSKAQREDCKKVYFVRQWPVFNMVCVEDIPVKPSTIEAGAEHSRIDDCERFIKGIPKAPPIVESLKRQAFYRPVSDEIHIPSINQFESAEFYYSVLIHELAHSTGHPSRLNRPTLTEYAPFGSQTYSKEELCAEITSYFACNYLGIDLPELQTNSAAYIKHWIGKLKDDPRYIWDASILAQKAFQYMTAN